MFRLSENDPPLASDFLSYFELKKAPGESCKGRGLSVFHALEHALHCADLFPDNGWTCVAEGQVQPGDGLVSSTGNTNNPHHRTFWRAIHLTPPAMAGQFTVVHNV